MKLIIISGPSAVGKATIGQELSKQTNLKFFHNHVSIELGLEFFKHGSDSFHKLNDGIRNLVFKTTANSEIDGLIFTFVWAYDLAEEYKYIESLIKPFEDVDADIYYVELYTNQDVRLERNKHENRIKMKPSKAYVLDSEEELVKADSKYRLNTNEEDRQYFKDKNYIKIDNSNLSPETVVKKIIDQFNLSHN